jgi:hypothetical protein
MSNPDVNSKHIPDRREGIGGRRVSDRDMYNDVCDKRFSRVEDGIEEMEKKIEKRIDTTDKKVDDLTVIVNNGLSDKVKWTFRLVLGLLGTMGTVIGLWIAYVNWLNDKLYDIIQRLPVP